MGKIASKTKEIYKPARSNTLLTLKEALALKDENNLVNNRANGLLGGIDDEVSLLGSLIGVIDTSEALDLAAAGSLVDAALVGLLAVLEGSGDVHKEERAVLGDGVAGVLAGGLVGGDRGGDDRGTSAGQLGSDEGNALDVGVAVLAGEAELGGELVADGVTEKEGDGAATLLVQGHLESAGNGILAGVHVTGQEDGETLGSARGVGLAEDLDNLGVGEPLGDVGTGTETAAELSAGDVQGLDALGNLVDGTVLVGVGQVGDHLELDDLDAELILVLLDGVLGIVGAVEVLALGVGTRTGVVTADNEVRGTVILTDNGVPDGLTRTTHTHSQTQKTQDGHAVGVTGQESLVGADTGEMVNVTGLGETDNGVDQDIGLARAGRADGQFTVSTVHGVTGLESDNAGPAQLVEVNAQFSGSVLGLISFQFQSQLYRFGEGRVQRRAT